MAITRSQIARQLLAEGGVSLDDAKAMAPEGEFLAYINPKEANMLKQAGGSGIMTPMGIPSFVEYGGAEATAGAAASQDQVDSFSGGDGDGGGGPPPSTGGGSDPIKAKPTYTPSSTIPNYGRNISNFERYMATLGTGLVTGSPIASYNVNKSLKEEQEKQKNLAGAVLSGSQFFGATPRSLTTAYKETTGMKTGPTSPPGGDGGDGPIIPRLPQIAQLPTDIETPASDLQKSFDVRFFLDPRFEAKDGGEVTVDQAEKMAPPGESLAYINDDEAALLKALGGAGRPVNPTGIPSFFIKKVFRGAKKAVKGVAKAVKKVAKSPLGKAALAGAAIYGLGGGFSGGFQFSKLPGASFLQGAKTGIGNFLLGTPGDMGGRVAGTGLLSKLGGKAGLGILGASVAGGLLSGKQEEEVDSISSRISKETGLPIAQIRKEVQDATAEGQDALDALKNKYPFLVRADSALKDGGKAKKKTYRYKDKPYGPKFAAEGGIMNLDGMEMDLRGGGFVPIGKVEKADDVPARLSKNEFVFTADAVRAAGGGSVDKGADLMYKTMKQLEDRVA
jgi:hypothetical protein